MGNTQQDEIIRKARVIKTNRMAGALIWVILGVILLVWPDSSMITLSQLIGLVLTVMGAGMIVLYFWNHDGLLTSYLQLAIGVIVGAVGMWIFLKPTQLVELIPTIFGIIVVISGLSDLSQTFTLGRQKYDRWWVSLLFAIATLVLGLALIFKPFGIARFITRVIGVVLIFNGASDLWIITRVSAEVKAARQEADAIDVESTIIDEERK